MRRLAALLAAASPLLALAVFGVVRTPDSPGYLAYAAQLRAGTVPAGAALLREGPSPVTLFRMGGYPALLAAMQALLPGVWPVATVLLQVAAGSVLAAGAYAAARRLGARRGEALAAAVLPSAGFAAVADVCLLTDALYAVLVAGAALRLAAGRGWRPALAAGAMLALATTLREATPLLALCFLPLAWVAGGGPVPGAAGGFGRAAGGVALLLALPWLVASGQVAWNVGRGAGPVLTTSRQTVMVQAVLPLLRRHPDLLAGDAPFDRAARATVGRGEYSGIDPLHGRLFADGLSAPDMAREASALYERAWRRHPLAMLGATLGNFRHEFLALPFQPVDTVGALMVYAGWPRPEFDRLNLLWARLRRGDVAAMGWIALDAATRLLGTAISLLGLLGPWGRGRDPEWRLRALWCVPVGLAVLYVPVHLEPRYLLPAVPVVCVLAACALRGGGARGETASEGSALRTSRQGGVTSLDPPPGAGRPLDPGGRLRRGGLATPPRPVPRPGPASAPGRAWA